MNDFRCYNCWGLIGYRGEKRSISCSRCNTELFTSGLKQEVIEGIKTPAEEHELLLGALHAKLARNPDIYEGRTDVIAGPKVRHKPDAIFYRYGSVYATMPIIYEVVTCSSIFDDDIISRCQLFAATAKNRLSQFYLVTPEICQAGNGKQLVLRMVNASDIRVADIITLGVATANT